MLKLRAFRARLALPLAVLMFAAVLPAFGQAPGQMSPEQMMAMPLPLDPNVRMGQLSNGMTYYLRVNKEPRQRAEFYIVHNVGAILENDDQNGLAHFTEHMAFNGTKHFPGKNLLNFLESNGVKFGADVNAFTTQEITCYNISDVPTTRTGLLDSCMLVLSDWSGDIAFDHQEIDDERGVISEEWRTRRTANWRSRDAQNKVLFRNSKYAERDVIGSLDLIQNFKYQTIKDFYHKWYRPDLQAIVVVGDFDIDEMEARVKKYAGVLPEHKEKTPKPTYTIPQAEGVDFGSYVDPEMQMTRIDLIYKLPPEQERPKNIGYFRDHLIQRLAVSMLNSRFSEIVERENPPFVMATSMNANFVRPMDNFFVVAIARPGGLQQALTGLITEAQRARQKGFVLSELDRAKVDLLRDYKKLYDEREKRSNASYIFEYIEHYTKGEPAPGIELELQLAQALIPTISVDDANAAIQKMMPGKDLVLFISAPENEKENIPNEQQAEELFNKIYDSSLDAWVDNVKNEPLMAEKPAPGRIVKEKKNKRFGTVEWTLSNGAKVIVKPTDFKEDEVVLYASAPGGLSLVSDADVYTASMVGAMAQQSGIGEFSSTELDKLSAGKKAYVSVGLQRDWATVQGSSSATLDELEFMLQQLHLRFTKPRFEKSAFDNVMDRMRTMLENEAKNPNSVFGNRFHAMMVDNVERGLPLTADKLDRISFERLRPLYEDQFNNAQNFTFYMVGNLDLDQLKPLVSQYLASLPKGEKREWRDAGLYLPEKPRTTTFSMQMETAKTRAGIAYIAPAKYTLENKVMVDAIEHVLSLRYTEEIREKEGGTYGVQENGYLVSKPKSMAVMMLMFDMNPEKDDALINRTDEIFYEIQESITEVDVDKAKKHFLKAQEELARKNRYWLTVLSEYEQNGMDRHTDFLKYVNKLDAKSVQKAAYELFRKANKVQLVMKGYTE